MGTHGHIQRHIHCEAIKWWAMYNHLSCITEILKLHQIVQMIVGSQRRIAKDICHIGSSQNFQPSTHIQIVSGSSHRGKDIDESLTVSHTVRILLGTDNLEIAGSHANIHHHTVEVGEIYRTLDIQRILIVGIEGKVV